MGNCVSEVIITGYIICIIDGLFLTIKVSLIMTMQCVHVPVL